MWEAVVVAAKWALAQVQAWLWANKGKIAGLVSFAVLGSLFMVGGLVSGNGANSEINGALAVCQESGIDVGYDLSLIGNYVPPPVAEETPPPVAPSEAFADNDAEQVRVAEEIIKAGLAAGVGEQGIVVALATAIQESQLRELDHGDRDSVGPFQQRPSMGWGTREEVKRADYSARGFFGGPRSPHYRESGRAEPPGLIEVDGWQQMAVTDAAQKVQRSGFPNAYAKHEPRARAIVAHFHDKYFNGIYQVPDPGTPAPPPADSPTAPPAEEGETAKPTLNSDEANQFRSAGFDIDKFCADEAIEQVAQQEGNAAQVVPSGTWVAPIESRVNSNFGNRFHPVFKEWRLHAGTDFRAAIGTPTRAASNGRIVFVGWDAGGGNMVKIDHGEGIQTWYLHLSTATVKIGDEVQGGQVVAFSGNTGTGTAPHFHLEVRQDGTPIDPEPFFKARGVDLRAWS